MSEHQLILDQTLIICKNKPRLSINEKQGLDYTLVVRQVRQESSPPASLAIVHVTSA
jgi:hypothetical protein